MKRWVTLVLLIAFISLSVLVYLLFFSARISSQKEQFYTFLIDTRSEDNTRTSLHAIIYHYPEAFILAYQISDKLMVPHPNPRLRTRTPYILAHSLGGQVLNESLKNLYGIVVDFTFTLAKSDTQKILKKLGGTPFFNLYSTHLPKGLVFIDADNYDPFIKNIEVPERSDETAIAIWYSLFKRQLTVASEQTSIQQSLISSLNTLKSNINRKTLALILTPLIKAKGAIYFRFIRSNLEKKSVQGRVIHVALDNGTYDQKKITSQLIAFRDRDLLYEQFPITMQIKNTTDIRRLAARTAGVLRIKKINVKEHLNSPIVLDSSVLLDFSHSPIKTDYVLKITRVDYILPLFDYRENFDFSLYIAGDYYGIELLRERLKP